MSKQRYILALDQGTTSSRALVLNRAGETVASAQQEFQQIYPKPGWVEHDSIEIWSTQNGTAVEAISRANLSSDSIAAVGLTNQRERGAFGARVGREKLLVACDLHVQRVEMRARLVRLADERLDLRALLRDLLLDARDLRALGVDARCVRRRREEATRDECEKCDGRTHDRSAARRGQS